VHQPHGGRRPLLRPGAPADPHALEDQCAATPDHALECIPNIAGESCASEFAMGGIGCPSAGVPAAGSATLLALTVSFVAAGGILAARRRRA
jgi:hypothetical protein